MKAGMSQKVMGEEVVGNGTDCWHTSRRRSAASLLPRRASSRCESDGTRTYKKSSALARFLPRISSAGTLGTGPSALSFGTAKWYFGCLDRFSSCGHT